MKTESRADSASSNLDGNKRVGTGDLLAEDVLTMTPVAVLHYEVARAWWPQFVSVGWMQTLASKYFAWKTRRIIARFRALDAMKKRVEARRTSSANSDSQTQSRISIPAKSSGLD
jgi:hypothetical protein